MPAQSSCWPMFRVVGGSVPGSGPLREVSRHVVQPVSVGGKLRHRSDACESVRALVFEGEMALVGVGHPLALGAEVVPPGVEIAGQAAARGELTLGSCAHTLARPPTVRLSISIVEREDRIIF